MPVPNHWYFALKLATEKFCCVVRIIEEKNQNQTPKEPTTGTVYSRWKYNQVFCYLQVLSFKECNNKLYFSILSDKFQLQQRVHN